MVLPTEVEATIADEEDLQNSVAVEEYFAEFVLAEPNVLDVDFSLGSARLVNVCAGDAPRETLDAAMTQVAELSDEITDVEYIGIQIRDCPSDSALNSIIVQTSDASRFLAGEIDRATYQALWRTVN